MNIKTFKKFSLAGLIITSIFFSSCEFGLEDSGENPVHAGYKDQYTLVGEKNFLTGFEPLNPDGDINVIVEIPTGTIEKWEVDKDSGYMIWEFKNDKLRIVKYLGYPGNYGMIPKTLLPEQSGGDGDPLDVIVLGPSVERGSVIKCKLIGVLKLLDGGEQDDKLIAIHESAPLYDVNGIDELNTNYNGVANIVEIWFENYKGPGELESLGFGDEVEAGQILQTAIEEFINLK